MHTIEDLLLPDTPQAVRKRYLTLAERAEQTSFGLLEEDLVVLDTETTGLSYRKNELIEIAAARISGREVVERFQTFVHPSVPIPPEIRELTGISDYDVRDAPDAIEAVSALAQFVGGQPVVAHNASFDRSFVESVAGGSEVSNIWVDSLALSRIALPRLGSHRLQDMAQAFGCASVTHRASDDVDALCGMWRIILLSLADLPSGLLERLCDMHPDVEWQYRPILRSIAQEGFANAFSLRDVRRQIITDSGTHAREDFAQMEGMYYAPTTQEIRDAFSSDGVVSRMYYDYERRDEQVEMAQQVRGALEASGHRAIEAGTGVGKSVAYLLPEILFAQHNNVTVGVATKTNALTDQLVSHELPVLDEALPDGVAYCSIKGYDHYPCLHRLELAMGRNLPNYVLERVEQYPDADVGDILTAFAVVAAFACQSPTGDVDALGIRWRLVPRELLTTTPSDCLRHRCPFYPNECFVHGARRRAANADVVVTNHSMLLRDIALDNAILPPIRHWVVDEAHSFEQEARRQWAKELSQEGVTTVFTQLGGIKTGVIHSLLTRSTKLDASTLVAGLLTKAAGCVQRAQTTCPALFESVHGLVALTKGSGGYDNITLWIDQTVRSSGEWELVEESAALAAASLEALAKCLSQTQSTLAPESATMASDLADPLRRVREVLDAINVIVLEPQGSYVYSAELYKAQRRRGRERLMAQKYDVGNDLAERWYPETSSVVYTSATIAVGNSFEHFDQAVGFNRLDPSMHSEVRLDSSYDYDGHMSVIVARDMPAPNDSRYLKALEDLLYNTHVGMDGSVLTLFTNRREMEQMYYALRPRLMEQGIPLICQDRQASPRRLREQFLGDERMCLFALKSFWEGFDAAGNTLRCVIIPKLPFASPQDPLVRERDVRESRAWWRYSLPEAVLSVKQAAGRLIRSSTDVGVLVLGDSRVVTKRYGRTFLNSMPTHNCTTLECTNVQRYLSMWRKSHRC
ncbi:MAG: helicase C-terminal domain-containing protein [Coriobacteriales bacterium]|nr:helicase C-terminal domain-containing protein [Coriobacteriales bacterium]